MSFKTLVKTTEKVVTDNSPTILTALAVTGSLTTAYLTGRATFKAAELIREEEFKLRVPAGQASPQLREMDTSEKAQLIWKLYIPAAGTAFFTIICIVGANQIGTRRSAAMAAAYITSDKAFTEYKEKVVEKIGEKKEREVRDEVAQDRVNNSKSPMMVVATDSGQVLCHDALSNQFFQSDMETIRRAVNDINAQIIHSDVATVSEFYDLIDAPGLEHTSMSDNIGWNSLRLMEINYTSVLHNERTPCLSIDFAVMPQPDPQRFNGSF